MSDPKKLTKAEMSLVQSLHEGRVARFKGSSRFGERPTRLAGRIAACYIVEVAQLGEDIQPRRNDV